ncbi:MAG: hypothetical protein K8F27_09770 [Sulfuricellaceae bacterium]|nr:hypothetical protein [Sulfuricellaceae bacterium]
MGRKRRLFGFLLLSFSLFLAAPAASAGTSPNSCIWYADDGGIRQLQTASTNQTPLGISLKEVRALAMNAKDCGVWVTFQKQLLHFDGSGAPLLQLKLSTLDKHLEEPSQLAVNAFDDSLWLSDEKHIFHATAQGALVNAWQSDGEIKQFDIALDETVWVLGEKRLTHYDAQGALLATLDWQGMHEFEPKFLRVDSLGNVLWLAGEKTLLQFDLNGIGKTEPAKPLHTLSTPNKISALTLDPFSGQIWTADKDQLTAYGRDGTKVTTVALKPLGIRNPEKLAFDPISHSLWLGSEKALSAFSDNGGYVASWLASEAMAVPEFAVLPTLEPISPLPGALTNNPVPSLVFAYDASCNSLPCRFDKSVFSTYNLAAMLNKQAIGPFAFDSATGQASYTPANRLPEGLNTLSAQVTDRFGHSSETVNSGFTIDTIPPKFLAISPADGSVFTTPQVTIQGRVDDPLATVMLVNSANWNAAGSNPATQNFNWSVVLKPGLNTLLLNAVDRAGNAAVATLHLTYNPVSVALASSIPGAAIDGSAMVVQGTWQGPPNTGITVNGVVAASDGNQFYANVPLQPGTNTLTVTATTPDGAVVTQTATVTSSGPSPIEVTASPEQGIAPLAVSFLVGNHTANGIQRIDVDFDGNGTVDFSTTDPAAPISFTYTKPGIYQAQVTVTDSLGIHSQTVLVSVLDAAKMDQMFKAMWDGLNGALIAKDKTKALQYLNSQAQDKYGPVFDALLPIMPQIVSSYSPPQSVSISSEIGEYAINRTIDGQNRIFLMYFMRDVDGVWRLDSM